MTKQDLDDYKVKGNHYSDRTFFDAATEFIFDDTKPVKERADIVRKYDWAMGEGEASPEMSDEALVVDFKRSME